MRDHAVQRDHSTDSGRLPSQPLTLLELTLSLGVQLEVLAIGIDRLSKLRKKFGTGCFHFPGSSTRTTFFCFCAKPGLLCDQDMPLGLCSGLSEECLQKENLEKAPYEPSSSGFIPGFTATIRYDSAPFPKVNAIHTWWLSPKNRRGMEQAAFWSNFCLLKALQGVRSFCIRRPSVLVEIPPRKSRDCAAKVTLFVRESSA